MSILKTRKCAILGDSAMILIGISLTIVILLVTFLHMMSALNPRVPISLANLHFRYRIYVVGILALFYIALLVVTQDFESITIALAVIQIVLIPINVVLHPQRIFRAVLHPQYETTESQNLLPPDIPVLVIDVDQVQRAYPVSFVSWHHIINDVVGSKRILVTFCPICNTGIGYDATGYGPFIVGGFYRGNMVMADKRTKTFWQQATGESLVGKLHPRQLELIRLDLLTWSMAKATYPNIQLVHASEKELRPFHMPFVWDFYMRSNIIPGVPKKERDDRLPQKAKVIGVPRLEGDVAYPKEEVLNQIWMRDDELKLLLVSKTRIVRGYYTEIEGVQLKLAYMPDQEEIRDEASHTAWNPNGQWIRGEIKRDLVKWPISEEYWFAWRQFHPFTDVRLLK
ncbi:MAG: DUF3179 domain-containing (seleno)protein [Candidatus Thorarchaeota archaeon]